MANIIGNINDINKIITIKDCNIICADDNCICGDAHNKQWRCDDCKGKILGECLHKDIHSNVLEVKQMCDACGKCEWLI